jgi:hypothetical protein
LLCRVGTIDASLGFMENDPAMNEMVRKVKIGRGRRVAITAVAILVVGLLLGVVVVGFRGRHILRNSAAMTAPAPVSAKAGWRWW